LSASGKIRYINVWGKVSSWVDPNVSPENQYFDVTGMRQAYKGEEALCLFLAGWLDLSVKVNKCQPEIDKLIAGDVSSLKALVSNPKVKDVKVVGCLTGIDHYENGSGETRFKNVIYTKRFYRGLLTGKFGETSETNYNNFVSKNAEYNTFKAEISTFRITEFDIDKLNQGFAQDKSDTTDPFASPAKTDTLPF
jgi:hypothetical protein